MDIPVVSPPVKGSFHLVLRIRLFVWCVVFAHVRLCVCVCVCVCMCVCVYVCMCVCVCVSR